MKQLALIGFILSFNYSFGQLSEDLIPKDAVTVLSINNMSLFQKVSLDELIQYDFMVDIQQELFDGSTAGKSIKDAGIDLTQKLNVFYGKTYDYEISGFTFGFTDKAQLFTVFDDFEKNASTYSDVEIYSSYFNQLILKGNAGLLIRVEPLQERIANVSDSIWYARGNEYYWGAYEGEFAFDNIEETILDIETEEIVNEEKIYGDSVTLTNETVFDDVRDVVSGKTYWELSDSVAYSLQKMYIKDLLDLQFIKQENLIKSDKRFADQLKHDCDGVFYLDNSRNLEKNQSFWYMQTMFPSLYNEMQQLYEGNLILGDIFLREKDIDFKLVSYYGDKLGTVYEKLNDAKFDKNVLKYINSNSSAYFTYNIDLREAYEQAYKVMVPILEKETSMQVTMNLLVLELLDEYINKDALFGTYKGSMFGTFNGIKKINTTKIVFEYNEDTFEYTEEETQAEEDMPIFTLGFSTQRSDIATKVLHRLSRFTSQIENAGNYWIYHDAILETAPVYFIITKGLVIVTNDFDMVDKHVNGYAEMAIKGKKAKEIKKNGFMYAEVDWKQTIDGLPRDLFTGEQNEIIDALRGKGGKMKLTSSKTTKSYTNIDVNYHFESDFEHSGKYILDFVNSIYLISK